MAEDAYDEELKIEEGRESAQRPKVYSRYSNRRCNARLEELAKPRKWIMLATWRECKDIFEPHRMQFVKEKIQEEFSMSPEETEVYFNQLRNRAGRSLNKRALAKQIRREKALAKEEAFRMFKKMLQKSMKYSFLHPPPPIVSPMMRETSDKILELLCEIHRVDIPKREATNKKNVFLMNLADWAAILVSNIYYDVNVNEKTDIARFNQYSKTSVKSSEKSQDRDTEGHTENEEEEETTQGSDASVVKSEPESEGPEQVKSEIKTEHDTEDEDAYGGYQYQE